MSGPLAGVRVVELAGLGPGPHGAMLLADLGAEVVRVDRPGAVPETRPAGPPPDVVGRGRRSVALDLKAPGGRAALRALTRRADVLVDPYRPGVLERLGLAPAGLLAEHPRLVVARVTGWGQDGPLAQRAGHDIDYLALAGGLRPLGDAGAPPRPPLNLVADYGGGSMLLALGVACALLERERSGRGQVLDVAMVDGVASLLAGTLGLRAAGAWSDERDANLLDGAAPWYRAYRTRDGEFVAVGALEPRFYAELLAELGLDPEDWPQGDRVGWPALADALAERFATRTRAEWEAAFAGTDACVAPALRFGELLAHPHLAARGTYAERDGLLQPAPAPRFSRTPGALGRPAPWPGEHTREVLDELGLDAGGLLAAGAAVALP